MELIFMWGWVALLPIAICEIYNNKQLKMKINENHKDRKNQFDVIYHKWSCENHEM